MRPSNSWTQFAQSSGARVCVSAIWAQKPPLWLRLHWGEVAAVGRGAGVGLAAGLSRHQAVLSRIIVPTRCVYMPGCSTPLVKQGWPEIMRSAGAVCRGRGNGCASHNNVAQ